MTVSERLALIHEVYVACYTATESFEKDSIGADLAYLFGLVASEGVHCCIWPRDRPIVRLLAELFGDRHPVWKFMEIE